MTLKQSYAWCTGVARSRARNFYYSFVLLSPPQRDAICAMYAFMRYCDDLSDDATVADRAGSIARWKAELDAALEGQFSGHPLWPAFHDAVRRYNIPHQYFYDMIAGVSSDLQPRRIQTFDELYHYCYQVASVVGLTIIHIFGFSDPAALPLAEKCGIAFQLTNILRDIAEDAANGRIYLPSDDLLRFSVTPHQLERAQDSPSFRSLMAFEGERAKTYYAESRPLIALVAPHSRKSLWALIEIYRQLLARLEASRYDVLRRRIRVSTPAKLAIVLRGWLALH